MSSSLARTHHCLCVAHLCEKRERNFILNEAFSFRIGLSLNLWGSAHSSSIITKPIFFNFTYISAIFHSFTPFVSAKFRHEGNNHFSWAILNTSHTRNAIHSRYCTRTVCTLYFQWLYRMSNRIKKSSIVNWERARFVYYFFAIFLFTKCTFLYCY